MWELFLQTFMIANLFLSNKLTQCVALLQWSISMHSIELGVHLQQISTQ
jgi:hypothetical protein